MNLLCTKTHPTRAQVATKLSCVAKGRRSNFLYASYHGQDESVVQGELAHASVPTQLINHESQHGAHFELRRSDDRNFFSSFFNSS